MTLRYAAKVTTGYPVKNPKPLVLFYNLRLFEPCKWHMPYVKNCLEYRSVKSASRNNRAFIVSRWRNGNKTSLHPWPAPRHRLLHDVRRLDNNASLPRDRHVANPQQAHLHHQATGTVYISRQHKQLTLLNDTPQPQSGTHVTDMSPRSPATEPPECAQEPDEIPRRSKPHRWLTTSFPPASQRGNHPRY